MPRNAFFTAYPTDDIQRLRLAGRSDSVKWGRSDIKLGKFQFLDFLDCTDCAKIKNLGLRLSERVFVYNNLLSPGTGYTPISLWHQLRDTRYISNTKEPRCTFRPEFTKSDSRYPLCPGKGSPHTTGV